MNDNQSRISESQKGKKMGRVLCFAKCVKNKARPKILGIHEAV